MQVKYARDSASVSFRGAQVRIAKGTHWPASDPIVAQYPALFCDDERFGMLYTEEPDGYDAPVVETATAAPGEKRNTRR